MKNLCLNHRRPVPRSIGVPVGTPVPAGRRPYREYHAALGRERKPTLAAAVVERGAGQLAEFGTTPFAYSRKDTVTMGKLHDTPTYRWISARNAQAVSYGAFVVSLPASATGVKSVELTGGSIKIALNGAGKTRALPLKR